MLLALALSVSPPALAGVAALDPASEARLAAGDVILIDRASAREGAVSVEGIADVKASGDALWHALLDFPARLAGNSSVKSFEFYKPSTPTEQWGAWMASHFGVNIVYHNHYILDRAHGILTHELDLTQPNDLEWSKGVYTFAPSPNNPAWLRLSYAVDTDFGAAIPGFIKSWLCGQGVRDYMAELVHRAEGGT